MSILVQDSFNRADGSIGVAETGQNPQVISGTWGITSQKARSTAVSGTSLVVWESGQSNVELSSDIVMGDNASVVFRLSDGSNFLMFRYYAPNAQFQIYKFVNGSATLISSKTVSAIPRNTTMNYKVIADGSSIKCFIGETEHFSISETFNQNATKHGFRDNYNTNGEDQYDNLLISSLTEEPIGTDGTISLSLTQKIYNDSFSPLSLYQSIYEDAVSIMNLTQSVYKDSSLNLSLLQNVYKDTETNLSLLQRMYTTGEIDLDLLINIRDDLVVFEKVLRRTLEINSKRKTSLEVKRSHRSTLNI